MTFDRPSGASNQQPQQRTLQRRSAGLYRHELTDRQHQILYYTHSHKRSCFRGSEDQREQDGYLFSESYERRTINALVRHGLLVQGENDTFRLTEAGLIALERWPVKWRG